MASLGDLFVRVGAEIDGFERAMGSVSQQLNAVERDAQKAFGGFERIGDRLTGLGTSLSIAVTAPLAALGFASVKAAADLESLTLGLTAVSGSAEETKKQMVQLREVAKLPGLGLQEAIQGSINLQAIGFSAQKSAEILTTFGNALATVGRGREDLNEVIRQLGQLAARGAVTADNLKPIIERVPQVAAIIKSSFGPEALGNPAETFKKIGVSAEQFIDVLLVELGKLPKVTGGLKNDLENFKDTVTIALGQIGAAIAPFVSSTLNIIVPAIESLASTFQSLSPEMQNVVVVTAGVVAAIGPLTVALATIISTGATVLGTITSLAGALGVAGLSSVFPVVAAGAALVGAAILAWNWGPTHDAIMSVWDALKNFGSSLADIFKAIQPAIEAVMGFAAAIGEVVLKLAGTGLLLNLKLMEGAIRAIGFVLGEVAAPALKFVVDRIIALIEWIAKLPGVSHVIEAVANKTTELKAAFNETIKAVSGFSKEATKAEKPTTDLSKANTTLKTTVAGLTDEQKKLIAQMSAGKKKTDEAKESIRKFNDELTLARLKAYTDEHRKLGAEVVRLEGLIRKAEASGRSWHDEAIQGAEDLARLGVAVADLSKVKIPDLVTAQSQIKTATGDLAEAFRTLGIRSTTDFNTVATEAAKARDAVLGSSIATDFEKKSAIYRALQAQIEAARAAGIEVPKEQIELLEKLKRETETRLPEVKRPWETFGKEVSTIITNFTQDIAKSLFDGDLSWGEKVKSMFKSLGEAVVSSFIQPATKALTDFISGVLADLLGGKGFGGIFDRLKDIGGSIADIFSGTSGTIAQTAGQTPSIPTGGGGGGAPTGGGGGGIGGAIGMVTGIVSAVSDVIGLFRSPLSKDTGRIEENTRYTQIILKDTLEEAVKWWPRLHDINLFNYTVLADSLNQITGSFAGITDRFMQIDELLRAHHLPVLEEIRDSLRSFTRGPEVSVTIQGNVIGNREFASQMAAEIAGRLRTQGALA